MSTPYDEYLKYKKKQISENPYYESARRTAFASMPNQENFKQYATQMGAPVGLVAQQDMNMRQARQQTLTGIVERSGARDIERKQRLSDEIAELEFKKDEYEDQQRDNWLSVGLQGAGAIVGGIAGGVWNAGLGTGAGAMAGASLGASLGQMIGGISTNEPVEFSQGMNSAINTVASTTNRLSMRKTAGKLGEINDIMASLDNESDRMALQNAYSNWVAIGAPLDMFEETFKPWRQ